MISHTTVFNRIKSVILRTNTWYIYKRFSNQGGTRVLGVKVCYEMNAVRWRGEQKSEDTLGEEVFNLTPPNPSCSSVLHHVNLLFDGNLFIFAERTRFFSNTRLVLYLGPSLASPGTNAISQPSALGFSSSPPPPTHSLSRDWIPSRQGLNLQRLNGRLESCLHSINRLRRDDGYAWKLNLGDGRHARCRQHGQHDRSTHLGCSDQWWSADWRSGMGHDLEYLIAAIPVCDWGGAWIGFQLLAANTVPRAYHLRANLLSDWRIRIFYVRVGWSFTSNCEWRPFRHCIIISSKLWLLHSPSWRLNLFVAIRTGELKS